MNNVKKISRNSELNPTPKYSVTFVARKSPTESGGKKYPGHAYVVWSKSENLEARGFYPPDAEKNFRKLEYKGALLDEYSTSASGQNLEVSRLEVLVTKQMFDYSMQAIRHWDQKETTYDLFVNNCVSFVAEVARALGLSVPSDTSWTTPRSFLDDLMRVNN